jgi:hypothetical protein
VSLFTAPVEAERRSNGLPLLILGYVEGSDEFLVIDDDGDFITLGSSEVRSNVRFDYGSHSWTEVNSFGEDESPDDGSTEFPGSVPDPDGDGDGHPLDEEGGQAPGNPGNVDTSETSGTEEYLA